LPIFVYGYETWFLTFRKGHMMKVFTNWVLRKIFWPKIGKVTGE
jgi:hypothetical protein